MWFRWNEVRARGTLVSWVPSAFVTRAGGVSMAVLISWYMGLAHALGGVPTNDKFAAAQQIQGIEGSVVGSNAGATSQAGEPVHGTSGTGKSIWYRWHPPFNVTVTFSTAGSTPDTVIAVYKGSSLPTLTPVASNDDAKPGVHYARVAFQAYDTTDYWIAVDSTAGDGGAILLSWTSVPSNDRFTSYRLLNGSSGSVLGDSSGSTLDVNEISAGGLDVTGTVWFAWPSLLSSDVTFDTLGSGYDTFVEVYVGDDIGNLSLIASDDNSGVDGLTSQLTWRADLGGRYRIAVGGRNGSSGHYRLTWHQTLPPPANDDLSAAKVLRGTAGQTLGSIDGATAEAFEPPVDMQSPNASVWFAWMAPRSGSVTFSGVGSLFASELGVYIGSDYTDLVRIATGEDHGVGAHSIARFQAIQGTSYRVSLDTEDGLTGAYTLTWNYDDQRTPNNDFARARRLNGFSGKVSGENFFANKEPGEPSHAGDPGGRSIWYRWQSPADFRIVFETTGSNFDTLLGVYTGEDLVSGLTLIASNDDFDHQLTSQVVFDAHAGTAYYIAVDSATEQGFKIAEIGEVELEWRPTRTDTLIFYPAKGMVGTRICIGVDEPEKVTSVTLSGSNVDFYLQDGALNVIVPAWASTGPIEVTRGALGSQITDTDFVVLPGSPPVLSVSSIAGGKIHLAWPSGFPEFKLQWTDDLSNSGIWRSGPAASLVGQEWSSDVWVDARANLRFYRLTLP